MLHARDGHEREPSPLVQVSVWIRDHHPLPNPALLGTGTTGSVMIVMKRVGCPWNTDGFFSPWEGFRCFDARSRSILDGIRRDARNAPRAIRDPSGTSVFPRGERFRQGASDIRSMARAVQPHGSTYQTMIGVIMPTTIHPSIPNPQCRSPCMRPGNPWVVIPP